MSLKEFLSYRIYIIENNTTVVERVLILIKFNEIKNSCIRPSNFEVKNLKVSLIITVVFHSNNYWSFNLLITGFSYSTLKR